MFGGQLKRDIASLRGMGLVAEMGTDSMEVLNTLERIAVAGEADSSLLCHSAG